MRIRAHTILLTVTCMMGLTFFPSCRNEEIRSESEITLNDSGIIMLPEPAYDSDVSLEESLKNRRSVRSFSDEPLSINEISQLLWAAQGITDESGHRTAPSAVALYPLAVYVVIGNVSGVVPGIYVYDPGNHSLACIHEGDVRNELADASLGQSAVRQGAVSFVITADIDFVMSRFAEKGERFAVLEAGHTAQNLCLQATALELGLVTAGAIDDEKVAGVLELPDNLTPLYVIPTGKIAK